MLGPIDFDPNLLPGLSETLKAFGDVGPADWMMLIGGCLWLVILKLSLWAIDRRDLHAGLTYMFFMLASGVTLIIALPSRLRPSQELHRSHLWTAVLLIIVSALRWYLRPPTTARVVVLTASPKGEAP